MSPLPTSSEMKTLLTFGGNNELVAALNQNGVRFLVVGGLAVSFHVPGRQANDLDLLLEQTQDNAVRLYRALEVLRVIPHFTHEDFAQRRPKQVPLKTLNFWADLLTTPEVDFAAEWERASVALIGYERVRVGSRELLIQMKSRAARGRDLEDVRLLSGDANPSR